MWFTTINGPVMIGKWYLLQNMIKFYSVNTVIVIVGILLNIVEVVIVVWIILIIIVCGLTTVLDRETINISLLVLWLRSPMQL